MDILYTSEIKDQGIPFMPVSLLSITMNQALKIIYLQANVREKPL